VQKVCIEKFKIVLFEFHIVKVIGNVMEIKYFSLSIGKFGYKLVDSHNCKANAITLECFSLYFVWLWRG